MRQFFLFLSYGQARGAIYLCMIVLILSNSKVIWLDWLIVIALFGASIFNFVVIFKFKEEEKQRVDEIAQSVENNVDKVRPAAIV